LSTVNFNVRIEVLRGAGSISTCQIRIIPTQLIGAYAQRHHEDL